MSDLHIDAHALEKEFVYYPAKLHEYLSVLSDCKKAQATADLAKKQLYEKLTYEAAKNGLPDGIKTTGDNVKAFVVSHSEYKKACEKCIQCDNSTDKAFNDVEAFRAKKDSMEALLKLLSMQYYATQAVSPIDTNNSIPTYKSR